MILGGMIYYTTDIISSYIIILVTIDNDTSTYTFCGDTTVQIIFVVVKLLCG